MLAEQRKAEIGAALRGGPDAPSITPEEVLALLDEIAEDERSFDAHMNEDHDIDNAISASTDAMVRWALGSDLRNRLWGPELERLSGIIDVLRSRLTDSSVPANTASAGKDGE